MRFSTAILALFTVFRAALADKATDDFVPFKKPVKDEILPAGKNYTFQWDTEGKYDGNVKISIMEGENIGKLEPGQGSQFIIPISNGEYETEIPDDLRDASTTYRIKATYEKDSSIFNYSPPFRVGKKSDSATTTTASNPTKTNDASATTISTSDPPSAATPAAKAPLALLGVAAVGAMMF